MKLRHLFFDLDNTLWDHRKNSVLCIQQLFQYNKVEQTYGLDFKDFYKVYETINEQLWADLRDAKIDKIDLRKHRFLDSFAHFGIHDEDLSFYFEEHFLDKIVNFNELLPNCIQVLAYLKSKSYQIHILSNGFKEVTHHKIKASGISQYISTITSADELNIRKPNPRIFEFCLNKANAHIKESLFIGDDWIADVEGALGIGMEVIFFNVLQQETHQDKVKEIRDLQELKQWL